MFPVLLLFRRGQRRSRSRRSRRSSAGGGGGHRKEKWWRTKSTRPDPTRPDPRPETSESVGTARELRVACCLLPAGQQPLKAPPTGHFCSPLGGLDWGRTPLVGGHPHDAAHLDSRIHCRCAVTNHRPAHFLSRCHHSSSSSSSSPSRSHPMYFPSISYSTSSSRH